MKEWIRKIFLSNKYGTGEDGDIVIDEPLYATRDMNYRTIKFVSNGKLEPLEYNIKVLV